MDLLDKLKLMRDELNLLIEAEEKKRGFQSTVGKSFQERVKEGMRMKDFNICDLGHVAELRRSMKINNEL